MFPWSATRSNGILKIRVIIPLDILSISRHYYRKGMKNMRSHFIREYKLFLIKWSSDLTENSSLEKLRNVQNYLTVVIA